MGAGYAYWTHDLKITGTVDTGELKVVFVRDPSNTIPNNAQYVTVDTSVNEDRDTLSFTIDGLHLGVGGHMAFRIRNEGTVPAKITEIQSIISDEHKALADQLRYRVDTIRYYSPIVGFTPPWQIGLTADNFDGFVTQLEGRLKNKPWTAGGGELVLEPGGWLEIVAAETGYNIQMLPTVTNNELQGETIEFDLIINFEQAH